MRKSLIFGILFLAVALIFVCCAKKPVQKEVQKKPAVEKQEKGIEKVKKVQEETAKETIEGKELEEKEVKEAELVEEKAGPTEEEMEILKKRIHFAFDSADLTEDSRLILKKKAKVLLKYPNIKVVIEGHCDERGTNEYNLALGERRAKAAYEYLILLGVDADRMKIISYGEERPLDPGHNEEAWAKNRRDEFRIIIDNEEK